MTGFPDRGYDGSVGGFVISDDADNAHDFERLERAVEALATAHRTQKRENASLRRQVEERNRRIRALGEQVLAANQKRQDVAKRIDELITQLGHLDAQFESPDS